jgi:hypothetical protein
MLDDDSQDGMDEGEDLHDGEDLQDFSIDDVEDEEEKTEVKRKEKEEKKKQSPIKDGKEGEEEGQTKEEVNRRIHAIMQSETSSAKEVDDAEDEGFSCMLENMIQLRADVMSGCVSDDGEPSLNKSPFKSPFKSPSSFSDIKFISHVQNVETARQR